jgi:hypothetical protein
MSLRHKCSHAVSLGTQPRAEFLGVSGETPVGEPEKLTVCVSRYFCTWNRQLQATDAEHHLPLTIYHYKTYVVISRRQAIFSLAFIAQDVPQENSERQIRILQRTRLSAGRRVSVRRRTQAPLFYHFPTELPQPIR